MSAAKLAAALLPALVTAGGTTAPAGERGAWFESLRVPGSTMSCCGIGDCHRTEANWRGGRWWAMVEGTWRPVPPWSVLASPLSIDGAAYVCNGSPTHSMGGDPIGPPIYCFVPPSTIM